MMPPEGDAIFDHTQVLPGVTSTEHVLFVNVVLCSITSQKLWEFFHGFVIIVRNAAGGQREADGP